MKKLIKSQFRLVFHNKLFYICLVLMLIDPITDFFGFLNPTAKYNLALPSIAGFFRSQIDIISIIFIVIFCCYDFTDGTEKNIIGRGYTRTQFILAKLIVSDTSLFIMYGITSLLFFILFIKNGFGYNIKLIYQIINSIGNIITFCVIFGTIALTIRKSGYSIVACLFGPNIVSIALGIIDAKMKLNISKFWIDTPYLKVFDKPTIGNLSISLLYSIIYVIVFIIIATKVLENREVK